MPPWKVPPMTRVFLFLLASLIGLTALSSCQAYHSSSMVDRPELHPTQRVIDLFFPGDTYRRVVPYEINLYGVHIFRNSLNWQYVEQYILWYFDHLNYPDRYGLTGSIYDYTLDDKGQETSTHTYDSADAYAATFLILLHAYYQEVGNRQILNYYQKKIKDIAYLMIFLRDGDGLTRAVPYRGAKYLMDNCEVYAGLKAFVALAKELSWTIPRFYEVAIGEIQFAIRTKLYDPFKGTFHWALYDKTVHPSRWQRFYPDALAQLFPIIYKVIDPSSPKARRIWDTFHTHYGMGNGVADHLQSLMISMARERVFLQGSMTTHEADGLDFPN